jgi:hydroxymethylpyrimidine pyrophosphatase-like HAD family hydrolase
VTAVGYAAMVVTDLDGTLLDSRGALSAANRGALEALRAAGVLRVVATGRNLHSALSALAEDVLIDYLVFASGAGIVHWPDRRLVHHRHLADAQALAAARALRALGLDFMLHAGVPDNHRFWFHRAGAPNPDFEHRLRRYASYALPWPPKAPRGPFSQLLAVALRDVADAEAAARHAQLRRLLEPLHVIRTTSPLDHRSAWFEVFPGGVSKASGADWLARRHALMPEAVLAVGNDFNDLDLLAWAGHPRVVDNAPAPLRKRYPTVAGNDADGFAAAVRTWRVGAV